MLLLFLLSDKFTLSPIMCRVFTRLKEAEMERYPASWLDKRAVTSAVTLTQPHSWDNGCFVVKEKQKKRCVLSASLFKECLKKLSVARKCHVVCVCVCVQKCLDDFWNTLFKSVMDIFFFIFNWYPATGWTHHHNSLPVYIKPAVWKVVIFNNNLKHTQHLA